MKTKIIKIEGNKIECIVDNEVAEYELETWVKPDYVKLGNAELKIIDGKVHYCTMEGDIQTEKPKEESEKAEKERVYDKYKSKEKENKYIVNIQGKDFMTYEGLLKKAHEKEGKFSMVILEKYVSEDMKKAWCIVRLTAGDVKFDGFGSSTPENTGTMTQSHPVEMAHTRSKGRALRDYLNIGQTMYEELKQDKEK